MKTEATFVTAGWDFTVNGEDDDWAIEAAYNDGFPHLVWARGVDRSLPVALIYFRAISKQRYIELEWETASEIENLGFIVERFDKGNGLWCEIATYRSDPALHGSGSSTDTCSYSWLDFDVHSGIRYEYRLIDVDYRQTRSELKTISIVHQVSEPVYQPSAYLLLEAFPNPFNPTTSISYSLPQPSNVTLTVYNIIGLSVHSLKDAHQPVGTYSIQWNGIDDSGNPVGTGVYFCRLQAGDYSKTIKMVYLK